MQKVDQISWRRDLNGYVGDGMSDHFSVTAEYQYLSNGKYRGVVVRSLIGRFSSDGFEFHCVTERNSKDEAVSDAKNLAARLCVRPSTSFQGI
jgi:hypothetical protein